jgi:hypothetical protein
LVAVFLGMGFYAAFVVDQNDMATIAKQLQQLMAHGLLDQRQRGRARNAAEPVL